MEGQPFFTSIAGLSVSIAGFGAVIAWLRDDPSGWDPVNLWRVKTIVRHALTIAFTCLALVPIHVHPGRRHHDSDWFGAAALFSLSDAWRVRDPDPVVWDPVSLRVFVSMTIGLGLLGIGNVIWASLGVLQALILVLLTSPAGIFSNFVREMGRRPGSSPETDPAV